VAGRLFVAGRRYLAVLRTAGRRRYPDRSRQFRVEAPHRVGGRPRDRRDLPDRRTARLRGAARVARGAVVPRLHQRLPDVVQDMERGNRRGQHLHVTAGWRDDLPDRGARGRLYAVAARRHASRRAGRRLRDRQPPEHPAEGRVAALDPPARFGPKEALCDAPGFAHASGSFGGADRRHGRRQGRGFSAHRFRRNAEARASALCHDVHGSAPYKRHVTSYLAEEIRAELS
jgi:hypothetical protein